MAAATTYAVLVELLKARQLKELREKFEELNVVDIADFIERLAGEDIVIAFRALHKDTAAEVFSYLSYDMQEQIVKSITDQEIANIINELFVDDAADFLEEMPAGVVKRVLKNASPDTRALINQFLQYPPDSAGSIMTAEFVGLKKTMTVRDAFARIRRDAVDRETIYTCYVMDENRHLEGITTVRELFMAPEDTLIGDIMDTKIISATTTDDQEHVARLFAKYDLLSLPVVDQENRLVGIVTVDDVVQVITQEATEDFQLMAATSPTERPYLRTSVWELARHRIIWLAVLMLSATVTGVVLQRYEEAFLAIPLLVSFIPMLTDTGGNAGSQSATLIIRGMAVDEIRPNDFFKVLWKEFRISLVVGASLGALNFVRIYLIHPGEPILSLTVSVSLMAVVVVAKTVGGILPMLAKVLKADPAIMASPVITTIVDAVGLLVYFKIVEAILL
jgi:magnesium transporter